MSLDTVVEEIREEARERAEEIRAEAEADAEAIVEEAEADAEAIKADAREEAERRIEQERDQKLSSANLEAKQQRLEARRDLIESVRTGVEDRIATLEGERREELTRALLDAAAAEFEGVDSARVYGREDDEALLRDVLGDYDGFEYAGPYECLGGVVVESDASRLRVNNTFDSILEELWEDELREISDRLFDGDAGES